MPETKQQRPKARGLALVGVLSSLAGGVGWGGGERSLKVTEAWKDGPHDCSNRGCSAVSHCQPGLLSYSLYSKNRHHTKHSGMQANSYRLSGWSCTETSKQREGYSEYSTPSEKEISRWTCLFWITRTVKKGYRFPICSRDVTNQTLPGWE
jgi:hypothetical protein